MATLHQGRRPGDPADLHSGSVRRALLNPSSSPSGLSVSRQNPHTAQQLSRAWGMGVTKQVPLRQLLQAHEEGVGHPHSGPCRRCREPETRPGLPTRRGFVRFHPARPETPPEVPPGCLNFTVPKVVLPFHGGSSYRQPSWERG